jgi:NADPH:quinone reductase-like Zn-dependent oxidoreductase
VRGVIYEGYGSSSVIRVADVLTPVPADDEVLLRVRAAAVNPLDWRIMRGSPYLLRMMYGGFAKPKLRPGRDVAGIVEGVGKNVRGLKPGDPVFGVCMGAFAEYACAREARVAIKPEGVTFDHAASVPVAAFTALQGLRDKGQIQRDHAVLINGAAGGVGTFAVQLAKWFGANVTGVCSARNVDLVRSIGADSVIDYSCENFTESGQRYDVILDCVANHSLAAYRRALNPAGTCVIAGAPHSLSTLGLATHFLAPAVSSRVGTQKFVTFVSKWSNEDLSLLGGLLAAGTITPVIDRRYELNQAAEAIAYVEEGHARGKVLLLPARA